MRLPVLLFALLVWGCQDTPSAPPVVLSPSGKIEVALVQNTAGQAGYVVRYEGRTVIDTSWWGFDFRDLPPLGRGLRLEGTTTSEFDETWEQPWGEQRLIRNHYRELAATFAEQAPPQRRLTVRFRVYDDGLGFRFEFPAQAGLDTLVIMDEHTEFQLTGDHTCWWIPGDWDIYEHLYTRSRFSRIDALSKRNHPNLIATHIPFNAVNTPVTMRTDDGLHLAFHEAALTNYPDMTLRVDTAALRMESELVGSDRFGWKALVTLPFHTPWRTIQISPDAAGLLASHLILNLNEPNELGDVSWVKPMKYNGIWWEMHLGISTWDMASGRHGATTENAKRYIDFAAANGLGGVLVEGWNTGWEHWIGFDDREGVFDFVTPYPDYDLEEVVRYAKEKGVTIIMHHETSAAPRTYEQQLDTAYALMQRLGLHTVKTGYVGQIIPKGEYHHGQWMVNHYRKVLETAARYQVAVNAHEPIKDTGIRRTLPNALSREGMRGQEFNAWASDGGNPPAHLPTVAFTRMLAGPFDFTPGVFNIKLDPWKPHNQVNTTLAQQLAAYVVIYSPVQMACDLPQHYEGHPAFQFIRDVAVDWEQTRVLGGEVGEYVTIARQERGTDRWFVGSLTNEQPRQLELAFDFLPSGKSYRAVIYRDADDAHWNDNPTAIEIEERRVDATTVLPVRLAPGGGCAISLFPLE